MAFPRPTGRIVCAAVAAACWLVALAPGRAETPRVLTFAYILPMRSQLGAGAEAFAAILAARTSGRFVVEPYPNAMLGGEVAVLDAMKADAIDLAFVTGAALPNVVPAAGLFDLPFLFRDAGEARHLLDGPMGDATLAMFDAVGLHALAWGENGMRHLTNARRPVRTPADLAGLTLRLPQSDVMKEGFQALGVEVKQVAFPQVYATLRAGIVDGQENSIATVVSSRFYETQRYLTLTGHVYDPAALLVSRDLWDTLSPADRDSFAAAARAAAKASRDYADEAERTGLDTIRAAGVEVTDHIDRMAFAAAVSGAEPLYEKRFGRDAIARIRALVARGRAAGSLAGEPADGLAGDHGGTAP